MPSLFMEPHGTQETWIYIKPDTKNGERITAALKDFGFGEIGLSVEDFVYPEKVIQLGVLPVRIDIITSLSGVAWDETSVWKICAPYGDIEVFFIGREQFIANKKATGKKRDIADLETLGIE
jgi:hypothetical protein